MTKTIEMTHLILVLAVGLAVAQQPSPAGAANDALLDAAQRNDLPGVMKALEQGADVNARSRYATALLYAARNVNLDMVKVLVERGADLSVEDTQDRLNALGTAVTNRNVELVRFLAEKGTPAGPDIVWSAVERKDLALLRTLLVRATISDATLAAMHAFNVKSGNSEVAAVLQAAMNGRPAAGGSIVSLPPATLQAYAGTYHQDSNAYFSNSTAQTVVIELSDGQLTATVGARGGVRLGRTNQGAPLPAARPILLFATSESSFVAPEMPSVDFRFERRGDVAERLFLNRPLRSREDPTAPYVRTANLPEAKPAGAISTDDLAVAPRDAPQPWPSFRGPNASGVADRQGAVADWDISTGRNIRWKTPIPGMGNSSPIVWGNRIYISTAIASSASDDTFFTGDFAGTASVKETSEQTLKLVALDLQTGRMVWERDVHKGVPKTLRHPKSSHAISTPVTDGRRVIVMFGTAGILASYDLNGALLWKKDFGLIDTGYFMDPTHQWGHSSSPIIYRNSVILQVDRQKQSFVAAYDLESGNELWQTSRNEEISTFGTPAIATGPSGDELITNGTRVRGYDPRTGKLRWTLGPNSEISIPTPVTGPDLVYVTGGYPPVRPIYAIRPGASGDISLKAGATTNEAIAWSNDRDGIYIPTPILYRGLLYTVNNNGVITVFDAQSGERVYRARLGVGGSFAASPVAADGRLYFASEDGEIFVVKAGRQFVQLAQMNMQEVVMAIAISDGLVIVRTMRHVYGIGDTSRQR